MRAAPWSCVAWIACVSATALMAGCLTPLGTACGQAVGEIAAQTCSAFLTSLCRDDDWDSSDDDVVVDEGEESARRLAEAPPPAWSPAPGVLACDVHADDDGKTRVSCAD